MVDKGRGKIQASLQNPSKFFVFFVVVLEAILMGFANINIKFALDSLEPVHLNAARWAVAAIGFWILILLGVFKVDYRGKPFRWALLVAFLLPVIYATVESPGIDRVTTAEATIILALMPVVVAFLSIFLLKSEISILSIIAFVLSVIGVVFTVDFSSGLAGDLLGFILIMGAVISGALYIIVSRLASKKFTSIELTFVMCNVGAVWFNGVNIIKGEFVRTYKLLFSSATGFVAVMYLGLVCSILCYALLNYGLAYMEPYKASLISGSLITLTGVATGVIFKGDLLSPLSLIGGVLILVGVILVALEEGRMAKRNRNLSKKEEDTASPKGSGGQA